MRIRNVLVLARPLHVLVFGPVLVLLGAAAICSAATTEAKPDFKLSRLCLFSVKHSSPTITIAVSKASGSGWTGVCFAGDDDTKAQSWWRRDGEFWKVLGKPIPAGSTAAQVAARHYPIPSADIPVLLDALNKARAKSPVKM